MSNITESLKDIILEQRSLHKKVLEYLSYEQFDITIIPYKPFKVQFTIHEKLFGTMDFSEYVNVIKKYAEKRIKEIDKQLNI